MSTQTNTPDPELGREMTILERAYACIQAGDRHGLKKLVLGPWADHNTFSVELLSDLVYNLYKMEGLQLKKLEEAANPKVDVNWDALAQSMAPGPILGPVNRPVHVVIRCKCGYNLGVTVPIGTSHIINCGCGWSSQVTLNW